MATETLVALSGVGLMFGLVLLWGFSIYQGKKIVSYLKNRHYTKWVELGEPQPYYFPTVKNQDWSKFISQQKYLSIPDNKLKEICRTQHILEKWALILTLAFIIVYGIIAIWYTYFT